jgi:hypothetical protein
MRKLNYLIGALAFAVAGVASAGVASAAVTSQTMTATVTPTKVGKKPKSRTPVTLKVETTTGYDNAALGPATTLAQIDFDKDFAFTTKGLATCDPTTLANTTTAQAIAACGSAQVGSGSAILAGAVGAQTAVVTAFNGPPVGGQPQILLHSRVDALSITAVLSGTVGSSPLGGNYGKRLTVTVPLLAGGHEAFTEFQTTVNKVTKIKKKGKKVKQGYVSANCDKDKTWLFSSVFTYADGSTKTAVSPNTACKPKKK